MARSSKHPVVMGLAFALFSLGLLLIFALALGLIVASTGLSILSVAVVALTLGEKRTDSQFAKGYELADYAMLAIGVALGVIVYSAWHSYCSGLTKYTGQFLFNFVGTQWGIVGATIPFLIRNDDYISELLPVWLARASAKKQQEATDLEVRQQERLRREGLDKSTSTNISAQGGNPPSH